MSPDPDTSALQRVTMNLTQRDVDYTAKLRARLHARSNAQAVSTALAMANSVSELLDGGGDLYYKDSKGELQRLLISGF